jgi:hypothetical protein
MAAAQPAPVRVGDDNIADWMAQRWRAITGLGPEAEAAGRRLWAQATRSGQDLSAPNPSDVYALGAQFLGGGTANSPTASQKQTASPLSSTLDTGENPTADDDWSDYPSLGDDKTSPPAFGQGGLLQLAAAPAKGFLDYWGVPGCRNCHGYTPDTLPPVGGHFPFPPNAIPRSGNSGGGGSGAPDSGSSSGRNPPQCAVQYGHDAEICRSLNAPDARQRCWASAVQREGYCIKSKGEVGYPDLITK